MHTDTRGHTGTGYGDSDRQFGEVNVKLIQVPSRRPDPVQSAEIQMIFMFD